MKTIFSLVTKPINQNVGIIRISGSEAFESIKKLIPDFIPERNKVSYHKIVNQQNQYIDEGLILSFFKPNSFTGENVIEIQSHGSIFVINKIISELNRFGIAQSEPGDFMKQAYMNNKLDLVQAEAINTLILSENKYLSEVASKNINGKQSKFINETLSELGEIVARIQISIDYPENTDLPEYNLKEIGKNIELLKIKLNNVINDSQKLIKYSKGLILSIVGIPNAGKSTLLNAFINEDRAIVSATEGTTRDIVESIIYINGIKFTLQDTAGLRETTNDEIEMIGIEKTKDSIVNSDIVLFLIDGTKNKNEQRKSFEKVLSGYENKVIEVISKNDLVNADNSISAILGNIDYLINKITKFVNNNIFDIDKNNNSILITDNQITNFRRIYESLEIALNFIISGETPDVIGFEIEQAMKLLGKILGVEINQDYINGLFSNFCLGK